MNRSGIPKSKRSGSSRDEGAGFKMLLSIGLQKKRLKKENKAGYQ